MLRMFVAVKPPAVVLDRLDAIERPAIEGVRYTTPAQWHLTLRFLGTGDPDEASTALSEVATSAAAVALGPRVEMLDKRVVVIPASGLDAMAAAVTDAFRGVGDADDDRDFRGHLTLARVRGRRLPPPARSLLGTPFDASFEASTIALLSSRLHPDGARYETLAELEL